MQAEGGGGLNSETGTGKGEIWSDNKMAARQTRLSDRAVCASVQKTNVGVVEQMEIV